VAWLCYSTLRPRLGAPFALLGAVVFVATPPVPAFAGMVMAEIPLALFAFLAVRSWSRFLARERVGDVVAFGGFALLAALTKGNGLFLALVPPLSILLGRRWGVLRARALWATALPAGVVAGVWFWIHLPTIREGWESTGWLEFVRYAATYYPWRILKSLGWVAAAVGVVGLWGRLVSRGGRAREESAERAVWECALAAPLALLLLHVLTPAGVAARHLIPAYPFLAMFVAAGAAEIAGALRGRGVRASVAVLAPAVLVLGGLGLEAHQRPGRGLIGFAAAAEVAGGAMPGGGGALVVSDPMGEGAFVAQMALRDRGRPASTVWRGTKLLARTTWAGREYRVRARSDGAVLDLLERAGVDVVVLDRSVAAYPHSAVLEATIAAHPERFHLLRVLPLRAGERVYPRALRLYRFVAPPGSAVGPPSLRQVPGYEGVEEIIPARPAPRAPAGAGPPARRAS
jgi:hypothetical protein